MTELVTCKSKTVRMDVRREKMGTPDDTFVTDEWYIYRNESALAFWDWSYKLDDLCHGGGHTLLQVLDLCCPKPAGIHLSRLYIGCKVATYCSANSFALASPDDRIL